MNPVCVNARGGGIIALIAALGALLSKLIGNTHFTLEQRTAGVQIWRTPS
jgi:hypothetical protein